MVVKRVGLLVMALFVIGCGPKAAGVPIDGRILCVEISGRRSPELVEPVQKVMEEKISPYLLWRQGYMRRITVVDTGCPAGALLLNLASDEPTDPAHLEQRLLSLYGVVDGTAHPVDPQEVKSPIMGLAISSLWEAGPDLRVAAGRTAENTGFVMVLLPGGQYKLASVGVSGFEGPAFIKRVRGTVALVQQGGRLVSVDLTTLQMTWTNEKQ